MPRPVFGNLAGASRDHILVACPTALSVIDRSKAKSTHVSVSSKTKRPSLKERVGTTLSAVMVSKSGPWAAKPLVRLSKPVLSRPNYGGSFTGEVIPSM